LFMAQLNSDYSPSMGTLIIVNTHFIYHDDGVYSPNLPDSHRCDALTLPVEAVGGSM